MERFFIWLDMQLSKIPRGMDKEQFINRVNGQWYVMLPNGRKTPKMYYDVALNHQSENGGTVHHISENHAKSKKS